MKLQELSRCTQVQVLDKMTPVYLTAQVNIKPGPMMGFPTMDMASPSHCVSRLSTWANSSVDVVKLGLFFPRYSCVLFSLLRGCRVDGGGCAFLPSQFLARGTEFSAPSRRAFRHRLTFADFSLSSSCILQILILPSVAPTRSIHTFTRIVLFHLISRQQLLWVLLQLPVTTRTTT